MDSLCFKGYNKEQNKNEKIFFQLRFLEERAYIVVVDEKNNELELPLKGVQLEERDERILELLQEIKIVDFFNISWGENKELTYLDENPELLTYLRESKRFVNEKMERLTFKQNLSNLSLQIKEGKEKDETLKSSLALNGKEGSFKFINEEHIIKRRKIYKIESVGENYQSISELNCSIKMERLEEYLTITLSYYDNLDIEYQDFEIKIDEEIKYTPEIIIEKISADKSIYIRFGFEISTISYNFLKESGIKRVVVVNQMERKIVINDLDRIAIEKSMEDVIKVLIKYQRKMKLRESYYIDGDLLIIQERLAKEFISKELLQLVSKYKFIGTEKLSKYKIKQTNPKVVTKLNHAIDFLEGDVEVEIEGEKFSVLDLLAQYRENSYIVLSDGTNALINEKYIRKLERVFKKGKDGKTIKVSFFDLPIIEELIGEKIENESLMPLRNIFKGLNEIDDKNIPKAKIDATLRNYQEYGYKWLNYILDNNLGGCLADDMGLGKTIQTISVLATTYLVRKEKKPSIIIMPKSLIHNWKSEIEKFCKDLSVQVYYGNNRSEIDLNAVNINLTTYGTVRNDIERLRKEKFEIIILDESQNIKNITSQITKAVMLLDSKKRIALSGTPVENNLGELYSLFRFLNPGMFGGVEEFNRLYGNPIQKENDLEAIDELKKKIYPFILRRLKKDVLKDLPDKIETTLFVEMNNRQKKLYEERRESYRTIIRERVMKDGVGKSQLYILQALNELRQIASCPESKSSGEVTSSKLDVLIENIIEAVNNNHKVLVFTNYINSIGNICEKLSENNIDHISMTGGTKNRYKLVEEFQGNPKCKVFVMTLKTGGVGLNLTAADKIFIYDPWWNKTAEDQAIDRSYRMGQDRTVFAYKLITKGTIEEKMLELQKRKSQLFESLITTDSIKAKKLSEEDIEYMLGV